MLTGSYYYNMIIYFVITSSSDLKINNFLIDKDWLIKCLYPVKFYTVLILLLIYRKPTSRYEVIQLKKTFNKMMIKLGITETDVEVKGPTQVCTLPCI